MDNNETTRRLRWALALDDRDAVRLMALGGLDASREQAAAWRRRDEGEGGAGIEAEGEAEAAAACPDVAVAALLDGLVRDRRGPSPSAPSHGSALAPGRRRMDNNAVLKALRIALQLRSEDVAALVAEGTTARGPDGDREGGAGAAGAVPTLSASEVGSLLRKPGTRNYRKCGDQVLRRFLNGLGARVRGPGDASGDGDASPRAAEPVR